MPLVSSTCCVDGFKTDIKVQVDGLLSDAIQQLKAETMTLCNKAINQLGAEAADDVDVMEELPDDDEPAPFTSAKAVKRKRPDQI